MDFRELEYIVAIAKHQGVGKAAKELYVTQPTLSKFVQNIEYILGQPLFRRLGNKFLLTQAGERYVETAKAILEAKKKLDHELSDILREDKGEMKIAFRLCGGINILPEVLALFWNQYPRVKVKIHENNSGVLEQEIADGEVDIAFITLPVKHPDITYEIISQEELVLVMSPDHPLANSGKNRPGCRYPWIDMEDLKDEAFILQWPHQRTRQASDKLFRAAHIKPNVILTVRNIAISVQLATNGFGLAFVGETALRYIQTKVKPACFSVGSPGTEFSFAVVYRQDMYLPNYMKQFIQITKSMLALPPSA